MDTNVNPATDAGQAPTSDSNPTGQAPTSNGQAPNENPNDTTPTLEELQRLVKELRAENAKHRKKATEQETARAAAEQQRMQEQGQYKELAERYQQELEALNPVKSQYDALSEQMTAQIESQIKHWPAEVKVFDPGKDAPVETRMEWMTKAQALVDKMQQQARASQPGNAPGPKPSAPTSEALQKSMIDRLRATGKYGSRN